MRRLARFGNLGRILHVRHRGLTRGGSIGRRVALFSIRDHGAAAKQ
jgi:hypothetical protein